MQAAFDLFTAGFDTWWPAKFSWTGADSLQEMGIEPHDGGALFEPGPYGLRWGLGSSARTGRTETDGVSWQIGPDRVPVRPSDATEVEVCFRAAESGSRVDVVHRYWERHGERGAQYRSDFEQAWPYALDRLAAVAG